jgi:hypothetical protein
MAGLDKAMGADADQEDAPRPAKRLQPSLSLYSALLKYGIKGKDKKKPATCVFILACRSRC